MASVTTLEGRVGSYRVLVALAAFLRVTLNSNGKAILAGVDERGIGQTDNITNAVDALTPVVLASAEGTARFIANAALAVGDDVFCAAAGKVGPYTASAVYIGKAMNATTADGDHIEVMHMAQHMSGVRNFVAGAAIAVDLRVILTATKLAVAGITAKEIGTIRVAALADLDVRPVTLRTAQGTVRMVANAAIAVGAAVYTAAAGKVGPSASTAFFLGEALTASTADGDVIEVLRNTHGDTAVA